MREVYIVTPTTQNPFAVCLRAASQPPAILPKSAGSAATNQPAAHLFPASSPIYNVLHSTLYDNAVNRLMRQSLALDNSRECKAPNALTRTPWPGNRRASHERDDCYI